MRRVVLASGNAGKLSEMRDILAGRGLEVVAQAELGIVPPPENGDSFAANALIKARHAAAASGLPAIADDSGLEIDALGGRPGLHSARWAGPDADDRANNVKLMTELAGAPEAARGADDPQPIVAEARWPGRIAFEARGAGGFGYDPWFIPAGGSRTAAEMPAAEKNRVSHRGQALAALAARMREAGW